MASTTLTATTVDGSATMAVVRGSSSAALAQNTASSVLSLEEGVSNPVHIVVTAQARAAAPIPSSTLY